MIKTVVSSALPIDEKLRIKKNILTNGKGKKRICIVTGTHGDELEGQYVCFELINKIKANMEKLDGTVEIYPSLNPLGIDSITRGVPNFDLDMNRIFPGNPEGSMAEAAAFAICEDLKGADMVIDIHSSNIFLREIPQIRINVDEAEHLVPYARMLNIDFIWVHESATVLQATLAHSLNRCSTPTIVVEMGVGMRINHSMGNELVRGILNLMKNMGIWKGEISPAVISEPVISNGDNVIFLNADKSGIFLTETRNNTIVEKDELIGKIVDPLSGDILQTIKASERGLLFTIRAYPVVYEGSLIARIYKL